MSLPPFSLTPRPAAGLADARTRFTALLPRSLLSSSASCLSARLVGRPRRPSSLDLSVSLLASDEPSEAFFLTIDDVRKTKFVIYLYFSIQ